MTNIYNSGDSGGGLTQDSVGPDEIRSSNEGNAGDILTKGTESDEFTYATPGGASIGNGSIDPIKLADISTGITQRGKLIALANNGVDFALAEPFSLTAGSINAANMFASGVVETAAIGDNQVTAAKFGSDVASNVNGVKVLTIRGVRTHSVSFGNFDYKTASPTAAGQLTYAASTRQLEVWPKANEINITRDALIVGQRIALSKQASGAPAGVRGVIESVSLGANTITVTLRDSDDTLTGAFAADDPVRLVTEGIFLTNTDQFTLSDGSVGITQLDIDGTAAVGKVAKVYDDSGTLKLQWADDNSGGGGGSNITLPLDLASSTNFSGLNPIARGGTGASTAAAARANLGVQASGGSSTEAGDLPTVTAIDAQPAGHIGEWVSASTGKPDSGSDSGVVERLSGGDQIATVGETGTTYFRTHSTSVDANWGSIGTPSPALPTVTSLTQMRAITDYQIVESTYASGNPQRTDRCIIARFPGGFGGHGYFCAIPPGGVGFWVTEIPSANFTFLTLSWRTWEFAPLPPEFSQYLHRDGAYEKVPAGQTGLVLDLQIASSTIADAFVTHTYTESTTNSEYAADFYTTGTTVRESTRGHDHTIGTWAKTQIDTDQLADEAVGEAQINDDIVTEDGAGNAVVVAPVGDLHSADFPGYTVVSSSNQLGVGTGRIWIDYANRRFFAAERTDVEHGLLADMLDRGFRINIVGTSDGATSKYINGTLTSPVTLPGGLNGGVYRDDWGTSAAQFAAGETVQIEARPAYVNQNDTLKTPNLGLTHGTSNANRIVYTDAEGDGFTTIDHITPTELPTVLADINALNERLTLRQRLEPRDFGNSYAHATYAVVGTTAGRFRWAASTRLLSVHPLAADDRLVEYLSVPGVDVQLTSTNGAVIRSTVEAVVANPAGISNSAVITVRLKNLAGHSTGDITGGAVTVRTLGSFIGRGDTDVVGLSELDISGTQAANKWLRVNSANTALEFTDAPSGGGGTGDTFIEDNYESKVYAAYTSRALSDIENLGEGQRAWDSSNSRLTLRPKSGETDLSPHLPAGSLVDIRGTGGLRLKGIITRADNPANAPSDAFTIQFDTTGDSLYRKSSGWDASTASVDIHCLSKVFSWDTVGTSISGGFGAIDAAMLDTSNVGTLNQHLGVTSVDGGRVQLGYMEGPSSRTTQILANHQTTNGGSISTNSFTDAASLLALPSFEIGHLNDMLDFLFTGVLYFNAGAIGSIGIEARLQYRYATTSAGLSTATWSTASIDLSGGLNDDELIFRSKLAAGGSGDGSFRDYMPTITAWGSVDSLTTGPAVGNHIEFRIQFRMPSNSGFNTVNSFYSWRQRVMICPVTS